MALTEAVETARRKAFVIVDDSLLRTDRMGMTGRRNRPFSSGKHTRHGRNVQVLADPGSKTPAPSCAARECH